VLRSLGFDVFVVPSRYDESDYPGDTPRQTALRHARGKLADVAARANGEVIVAADTVVELDGRAYGKPRDAADARRMLQELSGRTHVVHTAYAICTQAGRRERCEMTRVTFFRLAPDEIDEYVHSGEPMDKAGAYDRIDAACGLGGDHAVPLNDTSTGLGGERDLHAWLGEGVIGAGGLRAMMCGARWK